MKKFEYIVREGTYSELELNVVGGRGWELCAINYDEDNRTDIYIFKRLVE